MSRPTSKICSILLAAFAFSSAPVAWSADAPSEARYPHYDVQSFCHLHVNAFSSERRHQCEDREYAVSIFLRQHWPALTRSEPTLTAGCASMIEHFEVRPSYVSLLQCLTRVRDAAD